MVSFPYQDFCRQFIKKLKSSKQSIFQKWVFNQSGFLNSCYCYRSCFCYVNHLRVVECRQLVSVAWLKKKKLFWTVFCFLLLFFSLLIF